jgi:hypothetical protein
MNAEGAMFLGDAGAAEPACAGEGTGLPAGYG